MGYGTNVIFLTPGWSFVFSSPWLMWKRDSLGGMVLEIVLGSRRAKLEGQVNPSISIPALKMEIGMAARTPNFL